MGTSAVAVIQRVLAVEFWHHLVKDSPLWRESERARCLSYLPLTVSDEQER
jgi:hypothetical protein